MTSTAVMRLLGPMIVLAAIAVLAGGAQATTETPVEVPMLGRAYQPSELTVGRGQTVIWENQSITHHTVTSTTGLFASSSIGPGESYSLTFSNPGTFDYECTIHPTMKGSVVVLDLAPGTLTLRLSARRGRIVAHVQAARSGLVLLQVKRGGGWRTVVHGTLNAQGQATLTLHGTARSRVRAALPAGAGQPRLMSRAERSPA